MDNFWSTCLLRFEKELSPQQFNTWIKPLKVDVQPDAIRVLAPNRFVQQWIKDKFYTKIQTLADELLPEHVQIELDIHNGEKPASKTANGASTSSNPVTELILDQASITSKVAQNGTTSKTARRTANGEAKSGERRSSERASGLNLAFNFDNYVTGRANQLARAAAHSSR